MDDNTTAYIAGKLIGTPVIMGLITFGILRLVKKRKLTGKEIAISIAVGVVVFILILAQNMPTA